MALHWFFFFVQFYVLLLKHGGSDQEGEFLAMGALFRMGELKFFGGQLKVFSQYIAVITRTIMMTSDIMMMMIVKMRVVC